MAYLRQPDGNTASPSRPWVQKVVRISNPRTIPLHSEKRFGMNYPDPGTGYLAGEYPGGTTTVEGVPVAAEVRALWRGPAGHPADGAVCGTSTSNNDGTWMITGLSTDLVYDVVGRKEGYNDVIVSGVSPISLDIITYSGEFIEDEAFTKVAGRVSLVGGLPPYSISAVDGVPSGLLPEISGRELLVSGATEVETVSDINITVASSNGVETTIPTRLVFGFKAPANFKAKTVVVDDVFSVALTWEVTNSTQQIKVYRSATPFDLDDLPEPIATLSGTSTTYTDDDVIEDDHFYYMVTAVCEQYELESEAVAVLVIEGDPHWDKVVALLHFDESDQSTNLIDSTGRIWTTSGLARISTDHSVFGGSSLRVDLDGSLSYASSVSSPESILGTGDYTIEFFYRPVSLKNWRTPFQIGTWNSPGGLTVIVGGSSIKVCSDRLDSGDISHGMQINNWYHIAISREQGNLRVYVNGSLKKSVMHSRNIYSTSPIELFRGGGIVSPDEGNMDELRITKGVARYTENFTPPTEPFPNY